MEMLIFVVVLTLAIRKGIERGRHEYEHSRSRYATDLGRAHPAWSEAKVARRARRMARGYWWDQVRRGLPDTRAAYQEAREVAEAERLEAVRDGLKRRKEIRERMAKAIEEAEELRKAEWEAYQAGDRRSPDPPFWGDGRRKRRQALPDQPKPDPGPDQRPGDADSRQRPSPEPRSASQPRAADPESRPEDPPSAPPHPVETCPICTNTVPSAEMTMSLRDGTWSRRCARCRSRAGRADGPQTPSRPSPGDTDAGRARAPFERDAGEPAAQGARQETCARCATAVPAGALKRVYHNGSYRYWCSRCEKAADADVRVSECPRCGTEVRTADLQRVYRDGRYHHWCPRCAGAPDPGPGTGTKPPDGDNVVRLNRPPSTGGGAATTTAGGPAVTTTMTGEVTSYEQIHASYKADVERLEEAAAAYERRSAQQQSALEELRDADTAYERRIAGLRNLNADEQTIGDVARLREANERHITGAEEALERAAAAAEANRRQLAAAQEALDNWVTRQGAVRDVRQATGTRGDDALYA